MQHTSPASRMILDYLESTVLNDACDEDILKFKPAPTYSVIHSSNTVFGYPLHLENQFKDNLDVMIDLETKFHLFSTNFNISPKFFEQVFKDKFHISGYFEGRSLKMKRWGKSWPTY